MTENRGGQPPLDPPRRRALLELFPPSPAAAASPLVTSHRPAPPPEPLTYELFYGFTRNPFGARPDLQWLFRSSAFEAVLDEVRLGLREQHGVIVVTGGRGIGKTMLCLAVEAEIGAATPTSLIADAPQSAADLLQALLADFGAVSRAGAPADTTSRASLGELIGAFRSFLSTLASLNASATILVDDADDLPTDALQALGEICALDEAETTLHIVLTGTPSLRARLRQPELRLLHERVVVYAALEPIAPEEMTDYVAHRIVAAGATPQVEFDEAALRTAYEIAAGVPAVINALCDRALLRGSQRAASVIDRRCVLLAAEELELVDPAPASDMATVVGISVVLAVLAFGGALGAAWVFRDRVANGVELWEAVPPAPTPPALRQSVPLSPIPPP